MGRIVYLDGDYMPEERALVPPTDLGLLYGLGSFETVRLYQGMAFLAERHQERMRHALERLGIRPPAFDVAEILETLSGLNHLPDARGRVITTGGTETADGSPSEPRVFAEVSALPPEIRSREPGGVAVTIARGVLDRSAPVTGMKSLAYLPNYLARREARAHGADEAILTGPDGEIREGATSNVFLVIAGELVTPPADGSLLPGVTRGVVLEEARQLGIEVSERVILDATLAEAAEAFLTSTLREVLPISDFAGRRLPAPGPVTAGIGRAYRRRVDEMLARRRAR